MMIRNPRRSRRMQLHGSAFCAVPAGGPGRIAAVALLCLIGAWTAARAQAAEPCPPPGYDRAALRTLRAAHFAIADEQRRAALAHALTACLSSHDSELRDNIGYEAYAYWRRSKALDADTWRFVEQELLRVLSGRDDKVGVARPFAALVLADVVHADRDAPFLLPEQRTALLDAAIGYFIAVRDYRAFDEKVGWRHGVAHGADLLGELALEPGFDKPELDRILAALASQVVAHDDRVYVFGESERLAAAAANVAARGKHPVPAWQAWLAEVTAPAPLRSWADAYSTRPGVAKHQNTINFLLATYAELSLRPEEQVRALAPAVGEAMAPLR